MSRLIENKVYVQYVGEDDWKELGNLFGQIRIDRKIKEIYSLHSIQYGRDPRDIDSTLTFQLQWIVKQHEMYSDISGIPYNQDQINQIRRAELAKYIENPPPTETYPDTLDAFKDFISNIRVCKIKMVADEQTYIVDGVILYDYNPFDEQQMFRDNTDIVYLYIKLNCKLIEGAKITRVDDNIIDVEAKQCQEEKVVVAGELMDAESNAISIIT